MSVANGIGGAGSGAAAGAAIGSIIPGVGTVIGGGVGALAGLIGGLFTDNGSDEAAQAAQKIAQQQMDLATQWRQQSMSLAGPSAGELDSLSKQNSLAMQANSYAQQQVSLAKDIMRSSFGNVSLAQQQQQDILNGKIPSYLDPLQKQLAIQSQQAQNRINGTLGSGASSSSAGILASAQFGQQNAMTLMNAQQNALANLGQVGANNANIGFQAGQSPLAAFGLSGQFNQGALGGYQNIQNRMVGASQGTNIASFGGANSVGQLYAGQASQAQQNQLLGFGGSYALQSAFSPYSPFRSPSSGQTPAPVELVNPVSSGVPQWAGSTPFSGGGMNFNGPNPYSNAYGPGY